MNMNCTDIDTHIDDYFDGQLDAGVRADFQRHVATCVACTDRVEQMDAMLRNLRAAGTPEPSDNFDQRVFERVRQQYPEPRHGRFAAGFATAMAASLALWFASSVFIPQQSAQQQQPIAVSMHQPQTVRLMFDAATDIQQVSLSIDLPANMRLEGYPGQQQLSWHTRLKKGPNVLALPIMAVDEGQGELVAQLSYGDTVKTFRVVLTAANDGVMQYHLEAIKSA